LVILQDGKVIILKSTKRFLFSRISIPDEIPYQKKKEQFYDGVSAAFGQKIKEQNW
jgi:hypothetical protein